MSSNGHSASATDGGTNAPTDLLIHCCGMQSLPTTSVIVYADRAEVKRVLKVRAFAGRNRVEIHDISPVIESRSIRVDGLNSTFISDVSYEECSLTDAEGLGKMIADLESERSLVDESRAHISDQIVTLQKRIEVLDGVAKQISQNVFVTSNAEDANQQQNLTVPFNSFLLSTDTMTNLTSFLDYYGKMSNDMRQDLRAKEKELMQIKDKIEILERELDQLRCKHEYDNIKRNINITIKMETDATAELHISYQVYCVNWKPLYHIRASTSCSNETRENTVSIYYYGLIEQKADEDWKDAGLILCTATASLSGVVPAPALLTAALQRQINQQKRLSQRCRLSNGSQEEDMGISSYDYNELAEGAAAFRRLTTQRTGSDAELTQASEHLPSAFFPIEEKVSMDASGHCHQVMIAKIDLDPTFSHETVPSKTPVAFISVTATNSSKLPLLPGMASIFFNNSFISKQFIKTIMPGEEIRCLLGVDRSVNVEYKPGRKHVEQVGFMTKNCLSTFDPVISLRNGKTDQSVRVTVREPIPKPLDDKIKVSVITPDLKTSRSDAHVTKENNLEWVCTLNPGEHRDLPIKWTTEFPAHESIVYSTSTSGGSPSSLIKIC